MIYYVEIQVVDDALDTNPPLLLRSEAAFDSPVAAEHHRREVARRLKYRYRTLVMAR